MIQSYFQRFARVPEHGPDVIILDTSGFVKPLLKKIELLPGITWDDEDVIHRVMGYICYESKALEELSYSCLDLVERAGGTPFEKEAVVVANALAELGAHLYEQLSYLQAYTRGYLFYQFRGWAGSDMVLKRFEVDVDPND